MNQLYPVFLRLDAFETLIVGGWGIAWEKLELMFKHADNAVVTVVAPEICEEIRALAKKYPSQITLKERKFVPEDLEGKKLVMVALSLADVKEEVCAEANKRNVLVNVADTPNMCDAYLGSVIQKGDLKIAVSTNGKSPTLGKRIREMLEEVLPDNISEMANRLKGIRDGLKADFDYRVRKLDEITKVMKAEGEDDKLKK